MNLKLFFIRHGLSEANINPKLNLVIPDHYIALASVGIEQAKKAGNFLASYLYQNHQHLKCGTKLRVWASPYLRTRQTSKAIYDELQLLSGIFGLSYREDIALAEQQFGICDGISDLEFEQKYPDEFAHYQKCCQKQGRFWAKYPNGESRYEVAQRVRQFKGSVIRDYEKHGIDTVVIVAHGVSLRALQADWLHYPVEWFENEPNPNNASIRLIHGKEDKNFIFPGFSK